MDLPQRLQNRVYIHQYSNVADLSVCKGIVDRIISRDKLEISLEEGSIVYIKLASVSSNNEPYSWEAKQALYQMLANSEVYIISLREVRPQQLIADVCLPNGESATEMLINYGLASVQHCHYVPEKVFKYLRKIQAKAETVKRGIWGLDNKMPSPKKLYIKHLLFKQVKCVVCHVQSINNIHVVTIPGNFQIEVTIPGSQNVLNARKLKMIAKKCLLYKDIEMCFYSYDILTNRFRGRITKPHLAQLFAILWKNRRRKTKHHMYNSGDIGRTSHSQQKNKNKTFRKNRKSNTKKHIQKPVKTVQPLLKDVNDLFWQSGRKSTVPKYKNKGMYATVIEVLKGNSFTLRVRNQTIKNVFLSYIKFPWECNDMRNLCCERIQNLKLVSMYYTNGLRLCTREVLRKMLIGNTVHITVDYLDTLSKRIYCTMAVFGLNVGMMLVEEGLACYTKKIASNHKLKKKLSTGKRSRSHDIEPSNFNVNVACNTNNALELFHILETEEEITVIVEQVLSPSYIILFSLELGWLFAFSLIDFEEVCQANTGFSKKNWKDKITSLISDMCLQREVVFQVTAVDRNGVFHGDLTKQSWNLKELLLKKITKRNYLINTSVLFEIRPYRRIHKRKVKISVEEMYGHNVIPKTELMKLWMKRKRIKRHRRYLTSLHPVVTANKPASTQHATAIRRLKQCLSSCVKTKTSEALSLFENSPHFVFNNKKVRQRGRGNQRRQKESRIWSLQRKRNKSERRKRRHKE